jgi:CBS domain-containing protein
MDTTLENMPESVEAVYFLSDIIGRKVFNNNEKIGYLHDVAIRDHEKLPIVTHFIVNRPSGHKPLLVPWAKIVRIDPKAITVNLESAAQYEGEPEESQVLLNKDIIDKKVLDMDDNEIDVVHDFRLILNRGTLYVTDVDFGRYGLMKRLHLKPLIKLLFGDSSNLMKKDTLSWSYVQPLQENIGRPKGHVKLNVLKEKLLEIHPVDLADILEELNKEQRLALFNQLETGHASDTLEEIEPRVQKELIFSLKKEKAAELINDMTPGQAADILAILPAPEADEIMKLIDKESVRKIQYILDKQEEKLVNLSTSHFIKLSPNIHVSQVLLHFREMAKDKDEIMYIYIVDEKDTLLGVVDIKEVLQAKEEDKLEDIMTTSVISLKPEDTLLEAAEIFSRYDFRAIPVTDDHEVILGVVRYRDIMKLKHKFV